MDSRGKLRTSVNFEFPQIYPKPGWVEHRPADIWASVKKGIRAIQRKKICKPADIAAIGITNQRETAMLWYRQTGQPLNNAIEFLPALTGLGAPHWAPEARGILTGLTRGTERGHIARATLDAMALQNADILRAMQSDLGRRMKPLRVDGGASLNDLLMQIQADVLGLRLIRPAVTETTVAGACYLAGLGVGMWSSPAEVKKIWKAEREFKAQMKVPDRRRRLASWDTALQRTLL
jgi:glycerol kinase